MKRGMSRRVSADPDPTFYRAAANIRKEEERRKEEAERAEDGKKAVRLLLAVRHLTADSGFDLLEDYVIRSRKTGRIFRTEGKHDGQ